MRKWITIVALATVATVASAQNSHAFKEMDGFVDVFVNGSGNNWTLSLGPNPTVIRKGVAHEIKNVEGFWVISDDENLQGTGEDMGPFRWMSNTPGSGANSTFGWQTEQKNALRAGESFTFTFNSLNAAGIDAFGLKLHANGVPAHVRLNAAPIPEPASIAGFMVAGGLALIRRRRNKKS